MKLSMITLIGKKFLDNKNSAEAVCSNIIDIFDTYRDTNTEMDIDIDEMQRWLAQLPAVIKILAKGNKSVAADPQVLGEFKNFCKNIFSLKEQDELAREEKSEFEIIEAGLKKRIEREKNPSLDVESPQGTKTAPASPEMQIDPS